MSALQLVSGQAVGTLFDLEESQYMQERMEAERQNQGAFLPLLSPLFMNGFRAVIPGQIVSQQW